MSDVSWMVYRQRSDRAFVTDPLGTPEDTSPALKRLEQAYAVAATPKKPEWFRLVAKHWYLTYLPVGIAVFAIAAGKGTPILFSLVYGVLGGFLLGNAVAAVITIIATRQAKVAATKEVAASAAADKNRTVRVLPFDAYVAADSILAADPSQDELVHRLAWRISAADEPKDDPDAEDAADRLFALADRVRQR